MIDFIYKPLPEYSLYYILPTQVHQHIKIVNNRTDIKKLFVRFFHELLLRMSEQAFLIQILQLLPEPPQ